MNFHFDENVFLLFIFLAAMSVGKIINFFISYLPEVIKNEFIAACEGLNTTQKNINKTKRASFVDFLFCHNCQCHQIWLEYIPIFSWVVFKGRCACCNYRTSWRYPIVEILTGFVTVLIVCNFGEKNLLTLFAILFSWSIIALAFIDLENKLLPDYITLPLLWAGLLVNSQAYFVPLNDAVYGACIGYFILWLAYWFFKALTGKEGVGYGDFKLLAAIGAWLGWQEVPLTLALSCIFGIISGIGLTIIAKRDFHGRFPFGPCLGLAGFLVMLYREQIELYYYQIFLRLTAAFNGFVA